MTSFLWLRSPYIIPMHMIYPRNFRGIPAHGFANVKVKKSIFNPKILEFMGDIGIILNDF